MEECKLSNGKYKDCYNCLIMEERQKKGTVGKEICGTGRTPGQYPLPSMACWKPTSWEVKE